MTARPTEDDFRQHLETKFRVRLDAPKPFELELVEVKGYDPQPGEQRGMERFSLFFQGPGDLMLKQGTFTFEHERMGEQALFVVPVARNEQGFRYEVVFNYFKE